MRFEGKTVAITGGGGGIGSALVRRFAAEGASVRCIDIDSGRAHAAAAAAGSAAEAVVADVTVAADVERALAGRVDVLVNNTLSATGDNLVTIDDESWRRDMDGTLTSAFLCIRAVLPGMIERGGGDDRQRGLRERARLLRQRGLQRRQGRADQPQRLGRRALRPARRARQLGRAGHDPHGGLGRAPGARARPDGRASRAGIRSGASARPTRWPSAVLFLASDEASFVSGAVLTVDGGLTTGQVRMADELLVESRDAEV